MIVSIDPFIPTPFGGWRPLLGWFLGIWAVSFLFVRLSQRVSKCPWCSGNTGRSIHSLPPHYCNACGALLVDKDGKLAPMPKSVNVTPLNDPKFQTPAFHAGIAGFIAYGLTVLIVVHQWTSRWIPPLREALPAEFLWVGLLLLIGIDIQLFRNSGRRGLAMAAVILAVLVFILFTLIIPGRPNGL
jgi:hypothetical protein